MTLLYFKERVCILHLTLYCCFTAYSILNASLYFSKFYFYVAIEP